MYAPPWFRNLRSQSRPQPVSIKNWSIALVAVTAACAVAIGALAGWYSWQHQKLKLGQNLVATSRALIESADRELKQADIALRALSLSVNLRRGDLAAFKEQAREFLLPYDYFLIVSEPGGKRELINTATGPDTPQLPDEWVKGERQTSPPVTPLIRSAIGTWAVALHTTASSEAGTRYVLTLAVPWSRLQQVIAQQHFPSDWSPVILDQNWTVVARRFDPEKFVGRKAANEQLKDVVEPDSVYEARVLEGYSTFHARSRSQTYDWTAHVAVPFTTLAADFLGPAVLAAVTGFLIAILSAGVVSFLALRLGTDVKALSALAGELGRRHVTEIPRFKFQELAVIANEIHSAAKQLESEESFRKHLVEELAHRLHNKVATIQAILAYQLRSHPELLSVINGRLGALAATDQLIITAQGEGAELETIIRAELSAYESSRVVIAGPTLRLEPKLAMTMALLMHELATNASKYGSLSVPRGSVAIQWSLDGHRLRLEWKEIGGPIVVQPTRRGFGSRLVSGGAGVVRRRRVGSISAGRIGVHHEPDFFPARFCNGPGWIECRRRGTRRGAASLSAINTG